jgi:hypothetical protein
VAENTKIKQRHPTISFFMLASGTNKPSEFKALTGICQMTLIAPVEMVVGAPSPLSVPEDAQQRSHGARRCRRYEGISTVRIPHKIAHRKKRCELGDQLLLWLILRRSGMSAPDIWQRQ